MRPIRRPSAVERKMKATRDLPTGDRWQIETSLTFQPLRAAQSRFMERASTLDSHVELIFSRRIEDHCLLRQSFRILLTTHSFAAVHGFLQKRSAHDLDAEGYPLAGRHPAEKESYRKGIGITRRAARIREPAA